jgi:hypothetical protein
MAREMNHEPPPKMSEDQMKQAQVIGERMGKCMQAAMTPPEGQSNESQPRGQGQASP